MNLKEKFTNKYNEALEWAKENKGKVIAITVATVTGAVVVKNIVDSKDTVKTQNVIDTTKPEPVVIDDAEQWSDDMWQFKERDEDRVVDFCKENSISFNTSYRSAGYSYNGIEYDADGNRIGSTGSKSEPDLFD